MGFLPLLLARPCGEHPPARPAPPVRLAPGNHTESSACQGTMAEDLPSAEAKTSECCRPNSESPESCASDRSIQARKQRPSRIDEEQRAWRPTPTEISSPGRIALDSFPFVQQTTGRIAEH